MASRSARDAPPPTMYFPFAQSAKLNLVPEDPIRWISIRADGAGAAGLKPEVSRALAAVDPGLTFTLRTLGEDVRTGLGRERLVAALSGFSAFSPCRLRAWGSTDSRPTRSAAVGWRLVCG